MVFLDSLAAKDSLETPAPMVLKEDLDLKVQKENLELLDNKEHLD